MWLLLHGCASPGSGDSTWTGHVTDSEDSSIHQDDSGESGGSDTSGHTGESVPPDDTGPPPDDTGSPPPTTGFVLGLGGPSVDYVRDLARSPEGDLVVAGYFGETVDFDPGPGEAIRTAAGVTDGFVARYGPDLTLSWVVTFGGASADQANRVVVGADDAVTATGSFKDTADFGGGPVVATDEKDAFLATWEADGSLRWARGLGGIGDDEGFDVARAGDGGIVAVGEFSDRIEFDPDDETSTRYATGATDGWVARYGPDGAFGWAGAIGGYDADRAAAVASGADGSTLVAGMYSYRADLDPAEDTTFDVDAVGLWDVWLARYDAAGAFVAGTSFGGRDNDQVAPGALALADDGSAWLAGRFRDQVDLDPSDADDTRFAAGGDDLFVTHLDADFSLLGAFVLGGPEDDGATRIVFAADGGPVLTGWFRDAVDFDPTEVVDTRVAQGVDGAGDAFVGRWNADGALSWVVPLGAATSGDDSLALAAGLAVAPDGATFAAGRFYETIDADPSDAVVPLTCAGAYDGFVVGYDADGVLLPAP